MSGHSTVDGRYFQKNILFIFWKINFTFQPEERDRAAFFYCDGSSKRARVEMVS
jgi:hypothetical protein